MEKRKDIELVEVFAGELWQATIIQNILVDNQIEVFLGNEQSGTIVPWKVTEGGANPVKVIVSKSDYETSMRLIEEYNRELLEDDE